MGLLPDSKYLKVTLSDLNQDILEKASHHCKFCNSQANRVENMTYFDKPRYLSGLFPTCDACFEKITNEIKPGYKPELPANGPTICWHYCDKCENPFSNYQLCGYCGACLEYCCSCSDEQRNSIEHDKSESCGFCERVFTKQ